MSDHMRMECDEEGQRQAGCCVAPFGRRASNPGRRQHRRERVPRRSNRSPEVSDGVAASSTMVSARSPDGTLTIRLCPRPSGVAVQRNELRTSGACVVQWMFFPSASAFVAWCASDPLRFAYPLLFINVSRTGRDLFDSAG